MFDNMSKWEVGNGQKIKVLSNYWVDQGIILIDSVFTPTDNRDHAHLLTIMSNN